LRALVSQPEDAPVTPVILLMQRPYARPPKPPEALPFGRAALRLGQGGTPVLFGHEVRDGLASGLLPRPGGWDRVAERPVGAALDRVAGLAWRSLRRQLLDALGGVPVANPPRVRELCRDKLACQRLLEGADLPLPEATGAGEELRERLDAWGAAYLKPRVGSLGQGVRLLRRGDPLPADDDAVLQRAVLPGPGRAPVAIRVLVQRDLRGGWIVEEPVARLGAPGDVVVSFHGGAAARPASEVCDVGPIAELARRTADAIAAGPEADLVLELGIDLVLDAAGQPWILEVNSVPRGHLGALVEIDPAAWEERHVEACARPLRLLASRLPGP